MGEKLRYTLDDFKETKCCMTSYNTCRYLFEHFKCVAMFPFSWHANIMMAHTQRIARLENASMP